MHTAQVNQSFRAFMQAYNSEGVIPGIPSYRTFRYNEGRTPYIYGVHPAAAAPGDSVTLYGDFRWDKLRFDSGEPDEMRGIVREVSVGPFKCEFTPLESITSSLSRL